MSRQAVITGIGVVAPSGIGTGSLWESVTSGRGHLAPIDLFDASGYPARLAGQVPDFDVSAVLEPRSSIQMDRWSHLGMAAGDQALRDARLPLVSEETMTSGVCLASSSGGNAFGQRELSRLWNGGRWTVGAYQSIAWFYAASVGQLSIRHQYKGQSTVLVSEAAGAIDSLAHGARCIRRGADIVLTGATEGPLSPYALVCHLTGGMLSEGDDPGTAYTPFDRTASGFVLGEGGAVFVLEEAEHARARGATAYAEVTGWAATHDGVPWRRGSAVSDRYAAAMRLALQRAGVTPGDLGLVLPDALGVPEFDRAEAEALRAVVGDAVPVTTAKPLLGRATQAGSALDIAVGLLALRHRRVPPNAGLRDVADGCELNFAREEAALRGDHVMVAARGRDGFNSALVLGPPQAVEQRVAA